LLPTLSRDIRPRISCAVCGGYRPRIDIGYVELAELFQLIEKLVSPRGFLLVDFAQSETDMHQNVISRLDFRRVLKTNLLNDPAKVRFSHPHAVRVVRDLDQFTWNRQTHVLFCH